MTKQEKIQAVKDNQLGTIYSKDDVIRLLEDIEDSNPMGVSMQDIEKIVDEILICIDDALSNIRSIECYDVDNAEFSIYDGNKIQLDDLDIDFDHISTMVGKSRDTITDLLTDNLKLK